MANEIQLTVKINCRNGSFEHLFAPSTLNINQTTGYGSGGGQIINGSSACEQLVITDMTAAGLFYCKNLSSSVTVQLGRASSTAASNFTAFASLAPGDVMVARLAVTNPFAICTTTNSAAIQFYMLDA